MYRFAPADCKALAQKNPNGEGECGSDTFLGKYCRKSCGTCAKSQLKRWEALRWVEASNTFQTIRSDYAQFQNWAYQLSDASIEPLWHYCGSGNELLLDDLVECLPTAIGWGSKD